MVNHHLTDPTSDLQINPIRAKGYFVFQGEPAWKAYLLQELNDFRCPHPLSAIEPGQLEALAKIEVDFILSNFPLEEVSVPVFTYRWYHEK